mgnify:FL=1|tara:strand:+ start:1424 stop:1711 length:288 start_codon:yes stop_codon:yes gene_type:complete
MRVVINTRFGGFSLSVAAQEEYARLSGIPFETVPTFLESAARTDATLISVVNKLGDAASGRSASLRIIEIPDGVEFDIKEYDGWEHVAERHRTWG